MNNRGKLLSRCLKVRSIRDNTLVEFIFRGYCKNHCTYCYLKKYGNKMYPGNLGNDDETMLSNIGPVMDWCNLNNFWKEPHKKGITMFSGELFTDDFGFKVLEEIYKKCAELEDDNRPCSIVIPDNGNFIKYPNYVKKMEEYFKKFNSLEIDFHLSFSIDGKYCDKGRWIKGTESEEEIDQFYKKLVDFAVKYSCGFHPMVAADNIDDWKENFDWWMNVALKDENDKMEFLGDIHERTNLAALEVRNDDWTDEKIKKYIDLLDYEYNYYSEKFGEIYIQQRMCGISLLRTIGYDCFRLGGEHLEKFDQPMRQTCGVADNIHIRMSDLAIVPCHRQAYEHLVAGQLLKNAQGQICDIIGKNVENYIIQTHANEFMFPHCNSCIFNDCCVKHCYGAAYENSGNIFSPQLSVCKLFQAKIKYLFKKLDYKYEEEFCLYDPKVQRIFDLKRKYEKLGILDD